MSDIAERYFNLVRKQWAETSDAPCPPFTVATTFESLGFDSLDDVELIMEVEEEFDIGVPDDDASICRTVGEGLALIERMVREVEANG